MNRDALFEALNELSSAHGPKALAAAHASLQAAVRRKRKNVQQKMGPLVTAVKEALDLRDQMKEAGASDEELNRGLEAVLRERWPRAREEPWHPLCEACSDYGAELLECPAVPCERRTLHGPHSYLRPCWCKNARYSTERKAPVEADALDRAAKPRKPERFFR